METEESKAVNKGKPLYTYRCSERKEEKAFREYKMGSKNQAIRKEWRVNDPWAEREWFVGASQAKRW